MNGKVIAARRAVYRWLYERRVDSPGLYFETGDIGQAAGEPELSAALAFGLEMGHLEKKRGHFRLTAQGMLFAEAVDFIGREEN